MIFQSDDEAARHFGVFRKQGALHIEGVDLP
jgi:hypothetical protein